MTSAAAPLPFWLEDCCQRLAPSSSGHDAIRETSAVTHLNFNLRRLDIPMMMVLVEALRHNNFLQSINLTTALLGASQPNETLMPLSQLLREQPSLKRIHLSYNRLSDVISLGQALSTNTCLEELYLDYNQIGPESACAIADAIASNPNTKLRLLCLNSNRIGDLGGCALAKMLMTNESIRTLMISKNDLGEDTGRALFQALESSGNMTLSCLILDENPNLLSSDCIGRLENLVEANKAGRILLRQDQEPPVGLWANVLTGMDASPQFYMVKQLVPGFTSG